DPIAECDRVGALIAETPIDVAFVGIGENGHLAFNDPPADFEIENPYLVVNLDEACREQQFGEGWFASLEAVPEKAISMSVRQIMKSGSIICTVPDERKAEAVRNSVEGEVSPGGCLLRSYKSMETVNSISMSRQRACWVKGGRHEFDWNRFGGRRLDGCDLIAPFF
ncbi:hypothetical protein OAK70_03885, partial [Akkermansiaceae bacterium]|nr:hypothetical protein [Akkermansiaceae bacterium]